MFTVRIMQWLKLADLNTFSKIKAICVLQPIAYGGSCFIQTHSSKGLYNMGTASSMCTTKVIWQFKINSIKVLSLF